MKGIRELEARNGYKWLSTFCKWKRFLAGVKDPKYFYGKIDFINNKKNKEREFVQKFGPDIFVPVTIRLWHICLACKELSTSSVNLKPKPAAQLL